ncbi:MAG: cell division protein ZapA [Zoogloeaceae bacterium]|jgi:cell division protein ZapA|nr:cell division protein ZapA [Zoogloeaceae bacterium]
MSDAMSFLDVHILGREYRIVCPPGEEDALQAAVRMVDERMREIADKTKSSQPDRVAVMAALNIANEYLSALAANRADSQAEEIAASAATSFDSLVLKRKIDDMDTRLATLLETSS